MNPFLALSLTAALAGPAVAPQTTPAPAAQALLAQAARLHLDIPAGPAVRAAAGVQRDSLRNGATIGAWIGGIAVGAVTGVFCLLVDDSEGHGDCAAATVLWAGIGAGAGAALGAGVDALFDRPMVAARVRF